MTNSRLSSKVYDFIETTDRKKSGDCLSISEILLHKLKGSD